MIEINCLKNDKWSKTFNLLFYRLHQQKLEQLFKMSRLKQLTQTHSTILVTLLLIQSLVIPSLERNNVMGMLSLDPTLLLILMAEFVMLPTLLVFIWHFYNLFTDFKQLFENCMPALLQLFKVFSTNVKIFIYFLSVFILIFKMQDKYQVST